MSEIEPPDWLLVERVATGRATAAEWAAIDEWVGVDPRRRALIDEARRIVRGARAMPQPTFDAPATLSRMRAALDSSPRSRRIAVTIDSPRSTPWWWTRAAAVLIVAGAGLWLASRSRHPLSAERTYVTARGERATVRLADGSDVVLAPASRLTIAAAFGDRDRRVTLDGEGFFTIVHDPAKAFIVSTAKVVATDVGTSFDVRAYTTDSAAVVSVRDGRVSLALPFAPRASAVGLSAGDVGTISGGQLVARVHHMDPAGLGAWTTGRLDFRDAPLGDVVRVLSRWYDIDVRVGDSVIASRTVTASFAGEPVADILLIIARSTGAQLERQGSTMVLVSASPNRS